MRAVGTHNAVAAGAGEALLLSAVVVVATDEDWKGFAAAAEDC